MKQVSIIIPVYNSAKYLRETIMSIIEQTYTNYEAIFIDDNSTDGSIDVIKEYQQQDNRIKLIKLKRHRSVSIARNIGIRKAKGEYLAFLDADDIWTSEKLENQINFMQKKNCVFAYGAYRYINDKGTKIGKKIQVKEEINYKESLLDMKILTATAMLDISKIPKRYCYMPDIMNEDIATWWKILKKGYLAYGQNEVLAYCRNRKKSRSSNKFVTATARWEIYRNIEKLSLSRAIYYFINYIIHSTIKRIDISKRIPIKKFRKNDIQVAISTMELVNDNMVNELINKMNISTNYLIVNQSPNDNFIMNKNVVTRNEKGISKSRNIAIKENKKEIMLIADDDMTYQDNYADTVVDAYNKYPFADIICFYVQSDDNKRKIKRMHTGRINYLKAMRIASIEISFKRSSIIKNNLKFDEEMGIGTELNRGEEQKFLKDALSKGLKIVFVNKKIADVRQIKSNWFSKFDKKYFVIQGKVFKKLFPKYYKIVIFQYAVRKYSLYKKDMTFMKALKYMLEY